MGKIKELSTVLTNQIAAGEVIERPSSVVKELLENAIDAHSTRIEIQIEEAGLKSIKIIDNGDGMVHDDALLSIKRHTTSKLYSPEQLFRIRTLGFRGEALASITAISHTTIETSTGEDVGTKLTIKGGVVEADEVVAPIKGTTITVENIFYNTPARLKYVKTLQTEMAHISDIVGKLSLSHPDIAFVLKNDGNELLRTSGTGDLRQAIAGNLGTTNARKMLAFAGENNDFVVNGYTSLPELTRSNRNYLFIFINGRSIKNYAINKAIAAGYGSTLMVGRFPITVINIEMDCLLVDVNVHPTKQEVRISKEHELAALITQAIQQAIQAVQRIPSYEGGQQAVGFKRKPEGYQKPTVVQPQLNLSAQQLPSDLLDSNPLKSKQQFPTKAQQDARFKQGVHYPSGVENPLTENQANVNYPSGIANPVARGFETDAFNPTSAMNGTRKPKGTAYTKPSSHQQASSYANQHFGKPSEQARHLWNDNLKQSLTDGPSQLGEQLEASSQGGGVSVNGMSEGYDAKRSSVEGDYDSHNQIVDGNYDAPTSQVAESAIDLAQLDQKTQVTPADAHQPFGNDLSQTNCQCQRMTSADYLQLAAKTDYDEAPFEYGFPELEYFGTMHGTYLFAQNENGLYMVDQHAAQERIKYEQFKVEIGEVSRHLQPLLVPFVLEFSKKEYLYLEEKKATLEELGIFLEPFGANSFQIQAHPSWIKAGEELKTIEEMIEFVLKDEKATVATLRKATAIMMSCKGSIKANHRISELEARQLLEDLAKCKNPYNCPHGRPVMVHFSNKDMERLFKRIQDPHQSPINW